MKRKELLQQTDDQRQEEQLDFQIKADLQQLEADLLETQRKVNNHQKELKTLKSEEVLRPSKIIECQVLIEGFQNGEAALLKLKKELF